jgi:hypothetical protein
VSAFNIGAIPARQSSQPVLSKIEQANLAAGQKRDLAAGPRILTD